MQVKDLIKVLEPYTVLTIAYAAGNGERLYKAKLKEHPIPDYILNYYVTYINPTSSGLLFIEVHESSKFLEE